MVLKVFCVIDVFGVDNDYCYVYFLYCYDVWDFNLVNFYEFFNRSCWIYFCGCYEFGIGCLNFCEWFDFYV